MTIVSDKPQTTRTRCAACSTRPDAQVVFVDTPGIHKPRTLLGERLNDTADRRRSATSTSSCLVVDATAPVGRGDEFVAGRVPKDALVVVNKVDVALARSRSPRSCMRGGASSTWPSTSRSRPRTGEGVDALVEAHRRPGCPRARSYYPDDMVTDVPEAFWVAELVREQLLAVAREELPHSIATRVTEWEWPRIRSRSSSSATRQKGIVIGKGGAVLKEVGTAVREQLPEGAFLELFVKVDKDWQRRPKALERLGY